MPLPWVADSADQVAALWLASVQQFLGSPAGVLLTVLPSAQLGNVSLSAGQSTIQVSYTDAHNTPFTRTFGALLIAVGFGNENVQVGNHFRSFGFWEIDPFANPNYGVSGSSSPRVLILGRRRRCVAGLSAHHDAPALRRRGPQQVQLIYGCEHLTALYLLNRFLTLLIDEYLQQEHGMRVLVPQTRLDAVSGHGCNLTPTLCHGQPHDVDLISAPDCRVATPPGPKSRSTWDVIIVRHGITAGAQLLHNLRPLDRPRQILPYFLL